MTKIEGMFSHLCIYKFKQNSKDKKHAYTFKEATESIQKTLPGLSYYFKKWLIDNKKEFTINSIINIKPIRQFQNLEVLQGITTLITFTCNDEFRVSPIKKYVDTSCPLIVCFLPQVFLMAFLASKLLGAEHTTMSRKEC